MGNILKKGIVTLTAFSILGVGSLIGYNLIFNEKQSSIEVSQENITVSMKRSDIPLNHEWVITYDNGLNQDKISEESIYVIDDSNNKVPVTVSLKGSDTLSINPPTEGYLQGKSYDLYLDRDLDTENTGSKDLPNQYRIHFSTINHL